MRTRQLHQLRCCTQRELGRQRVGMLDQRQQLQYTQAHARVRRSTVGTSAAKTTRGAQWQPGGGVRVGAVRDHAVAFSGISGGDRRWKISPLHDRCHFKQQQDYRPLRQAASSHLTTHRHIGTPRRRPPNPCSRAPLVFSSSPNNLAPPTPPFALPQATAPLRQQIVTDPGAIDAQAWNALLARQRASTPFMRHEYLAALHASGSAVPETGWTPRFVLLWDGAELAAACPLYVKAHSYGEYVFDWAWANAYAEHGLRYYPKAVVCVPFTPVPGSRLLARGDAARAALVQALIAWCEQRKLSSLHVLFGDSDDLAVCEEAG